MKRLPFAGCLLAGIKFEELIRIGLRIIFRRLKHFKFQSVIKFGHNHVKSFYQGLLFNRLFRLAVVPGIKVECLMVKRNSTTRHWTIKH